MLLRETNRPSCYRTGKTYLCLRLLVMVMMSFAIMDWKIYMPTSGLGTIVIQPKERYGIREVPTLLLACTKPWYITVILPIILLSALIFLNVTCIPYS